VDWKYCLGLEPADEGFEFTALNRFRHRLLADCAGAAAVGQQHYRDGEKVVRREEREHGLPPGRPPGLPV
jgi:hypothetical protein